MTLVAALEPWELPAIAECLLTRLILRFSQKRQAGHAAATSTEPKAVMARLVVGRGMPVPAGQEGLVATGLAGAITYLMVLAVPSRSYPTVARAEWADRADMPILARKVEREAKVVMARPVTVSKAEQELVERVEQADQEVEVVPAEMGVKAVPVALVGR